MSRTLTCWKEVARYLGKGVRTVQRWERDLGLPIHRRHGRMKGTLLAYCDEIDAWMSARFERPNDSELNLLRREVVQLREQNHLLRAKLELAERNLIFVPLREASEVEDWADEVLRRRCTNAVARNDVLRQQSLHVFDIARKDTEIRRTQRAQNLPVFGSSFVQ